MIWMRTSCAGNEPWAMEKKNGYGYTYAAPLKVWASIIIHLWIFCGCAFFIIYIPAPKTWQFLSEALGKLPSRFLAPLQIFFSVPQPSSTRAETIWNDLRCKAKVFVLLPAWRSNAIWANAACVGHPQNLEALRASGADVKAGAKGHQKSNAFCSKKKEVWICYVSRYVKAYIKQVLRASCNCQAKRLHEEGSVHAAWCTTNFLDTSATHDSSTQLCNLRSWLKVEGRWNECCDFVCSKRFDFFPMQIHKMETEHCFEGGSRVASIFFGVTSQEASCMCPFWGHYLLLGRLEVCQTQLLLYLIWELGMKQSRPGFGWWPHSFHRLSPFRWKVTVVPVLVLMAEANIQSGPLDWTWSTLLYVLRWLICSWDFIGVFFLQPTTKIWAPNWGSLDRWKLEVWMPVLSVWLPQPRYRMGLPISWASQAASPAYLCCLLAHDWIAWIASFCQPGICFWSFMCLSPRWWPISLFAGYRRYWSCMSLPFLLLQRNINTGTSKQNSHHKF